MTKLKRYFAALLTAVFFLFPVHASASGSWLGYISDQTGALSSDELELIQQLLTGNAEQLEINIGILLTDKAPGGEEQTASDFIDSSFGKYSDSLVLLLGEESSGIIDTLLFSGKAEDMFASQRDHIFDAVYYGLDSGEIPNYTAAATQLCNYLMANRDGYERDITGGITYMSRLVDHQGVLTDAELTELGETLQITADNIGANVGVVLSDSLDGKTSRQYTDDFLSDSFGYDSSSIVLMLVKSGSGNQDFISESHHANDIYASHRDRIFREVYNGLDSGSGDNYPAAIKNFCRYLETHTKPYSGSFEQGFHLNTGNVAGIIIALVITLVVVGTTSAGYRKKAPISARAYMDTTRTHFTERRDMFIREYTTSHRVSSSSSGSGGGGSHRSGGGGHSRSGGHSGGGGRRR